MRKNVLAIVFTCSLCSLFLLLPASAIPASQPQAPGNRFFVVLLNLGPKYDRTLGPFAQPGIRDHAAYMSQLTKEGKLLVAGPFVEAPGSLTATGAMLLVLAPSVEEARKIVMADPGQAAGLFEIGEIRPLVITGGSWVKQAM